MGLRVFSAIIAAIACTACATTLVPVSASSTQIVAAVTHGDRPQEDRERDAFRKPAEMLAFAGVRPGYRVLDLIPGGGYFTRIFAVAVGSKGRVYGVSYLNPPQATRPQPILALAEHYSNVTASLQDLRTPRFESGLDVVWVSQDYHDFLIPRMQEGLGFDPDAIDRAIFAALRPGGVFIVVDHSAEDGSGLRDTPRLHRIDQAVVLSRLEAVGFVYDGETQTLRNPNDPRNASVFDPSIRGRTDQFVMRFRKP